MAQRFVLYKKSISSLGFSPRFNCKKAKLLDLNNPYPAASSWSLSSLPSSSPPWCISFINHGTTVASLCFWNMHFSYPKSIILIVISNNSVFPFLQFFSSFKRCIFTYLFSLVNCPNQLCQLRCFSKTEGVTLTPELESWGQCLNQNFPFWCTQSCWGHNV